MIGDSFWHDNWNELVDELIACHNDTDIYQSPILKTMLRRDIIILSTLDRIMNELTKQSKKKRVSQSNYQEEALRTARNVENPEMLLEEALMGLCGESGEAMDILKKHLFQGHELDREALALELGDVAWYLAMAAHAIGYGLNDILDLNIEKLKKRYPDGFNSEASVNRTD